MATFKKGRRKTFDLGVLNMVAVMKHDGFHVQEFTALVGGSSGKNGESMETLNVPAELLALVKLGAELPIKWTTEMADALKESVQDDYKRIMAEHFFKSFLTSEIQETQEKSVKSFQRTFQCHDATGDQVLYFLKVLIVQTSSVCTALCSLFHFQ